MISVCFMSVSDFDYLCHADGEVFDIDVGKWRKNSSWQWHEETAVESEQLVGRIRGKITGRLETTHQKTPAQNDQTQDNGYQYDSDTGNGTQDNIQQWNGVQQNNTDWNNSSQWNNNSQNNNVQNNNAQNNNVQSNNARNNNSAWNAQPQTDNNMQITSRTDNESAVKISENPPQHQYLYQHLNLRKIRSRQKHPNQLSPQLLSCQKRKIRRNKIKQRKQKKKTRIQVIPKCFRIKKTRGILLNTRM